MLQTYKLKTRKDSRWELSKAHALVRGARCESSVKEANRTTKL
jgi:hypothetical protein